jgi:hypothetical protein
MLIQNLVTFLWGLQVFRISPREILVSCQAIVAVDLLPLRLQTCLLYSGISSRVDKTVNPRDSIVRVSSVSADCASGRWEWDLGRKGYSLHVLPLATCNTPFGDGQGQTDRQTATLNHEISTVCWTKPKTITQKTSGLLVGSEQVTWHNRLPAVWRWLWLWTFLWGYQSLFIHQLLHNWLS